MAPTWTVDPDTGCHVWQGATIEGYPVVGRNGRRVSVRRWLVPDLKRGEIIRLSCGNGRCVNPEHFIRKQTGRQAWGVSRRAARGLIAPDGMPARRSYEIDEDGCHLWLGQLRHGYPIATWQGKQLSVRSLVAKAPPNTRVDSICGKTRCVKASHLFIPGVQKAALLERKRDLEMAKSPDEPRDLRRVLEDARRLIDEAERTHGHKGVKPAHWMDALRWRRGMSIKAIARLNGVTSPAITWRLQRVDQQLRRNEEERSAEARLRRRRLCATLSLVDPLPEPEVEIPMKTYRVYVPAVITFRTPQTWSRKRAARELSEAVLVSRLGAAKFRPSDILKVSTGPVAEEDVVDAGEDIE